MALPLKKYTLIPTDEGTLDPLYPDGNTPPGAPGLGALAVIGTAQITVPLETASIGGILPLSYTLERSQTSGTAGFAVISSDAFSSMDAVYQDLGLTPNTAYWYRCFAVDSNVTPQSSEYSNVVTATTNPVVGDTEVPSAIASFTSTGVTTTTINLQWSAATDNVGVAKYQLLQGMGDGTFSSIPAFPSTAFVFDVGNVLTYSVTGLLPGTEYYFRVRAYDAAGNGGPQTSRIWAITTAVSTAAQTYYINGSTGSDANNGLSQTLSGGTNGPWATITRANNVQPHASGHADIMVAPGDYRDQPWIPQYGGTNDAHRIRMRVNGAGIVRILGPVDNDIEWGALIEVPFVSMLRESASSYFLFDGEIEFGPGLEEKGENPWQSARIQEGMWIRAADVVMECKLTRLYGWNGISLSRGGYARGIFAVEIDQLGSPYTDDPQNDLGDGLFTWRYMNPAAEWTLMHGGTTGLRMDHCGHAGACFMANGYGQIRNISFDNSWADIPTFGTNPTTNNPSISYPDGNRCLGGFSAEAFDSHGLSLICQRNGIPSDGQYIESAELTKLEGTRNGFFDSVFRNGAQQVIHTAIRDGAHWCRQLRVAHCAIDQIQGPLIDLQDYYELPEDGGGLGPYYDLCWKNILARNVCYNGRNVPGKSPWVDALAIVQLRSGTSLAATFPNGLIHGLTLQENLGRDWDDFWMGIYGTSELNGEYSVQYLLDNFPWFISNFTLTTNCGLTNAPAAAADASLTNIVGQYLPVGGPAALSIGQGVNLTTVAAADSGSGTTLYVSDPTWLPNPVFAAAPFPPIAFGERSVTGFTLHCNGANRQYTAVDYTTGAVTVTAGFSRSDGMPVNLGIASGNVPNRGIRGLL